MLAYYSCGWQSNQIILKVDTSGKKRAIGFDIKMAWLAISRMYNAEAKVQEITTNSGFVLLHIDEEEGTPATKIAPLMGMEARSLTRMLNRLEQQGLIMRKDDKFDRRMVRIFLTPKGLEMKAHAKKVVLDFNSKVYGSIPEEKLSTFFEVIDQLHDIIKLKSFENR